MENPRNIHSIAVGNLENTTRDEEDARLFFGGFKNSLENVGIDLNREGLRVLEVGSGNANFLNYAKKQGLDIVGVDINPRGESGPQVTARIEDLPFPDASFDVLYSYFVFDSGIYSQNQAQMFEEMRRVLKLDGVLISDGMFGGSEYDYFKKILDGPHNVYKKK